MDEEKSEEKSSPGSNTETREHLANERTLLAWVRTGIGLISVGFVVERAGALASSVGQGTDASTEIFGLSLVGLGCVALVVGARQFFASRRMIRAGEFESRVLPYMVVVSGSILLALSFIVYVLSN